jgi:hypothetical protein
MRLGFVILNHREPAQLLRLIGTLRKQLPDAPIVVHNDNDRVDLPGSPLDVFGDVHLLTNNTPLQWGDFSIQNAFWRSIACMVDSIEFDWLVVLSAQDYPIKPLTGLSDRLSKTRADALLRATPIRELGSRSDRRNMRRRYLYQYRPSPAPSTAKLRLLLRRSISPFVDVFNNVQPCVQVYKLPDGIPWRLGLRARSTPFSEHEPCWFGSTWHTLSYRAACLLVETIRSKSACVDYYRRTIMPAESATATLICNAPELSVESSEVHYARWSAPRTGHPDLLGTEDLPELVKAPGYFARKFDITKDSKILDLLDDYLESPDALLENETLSL